MKRLYKWLGTQVHTSYGPWVFALLVFIEGFFIVPVSTLLAFYSLENRPKALHYALLASIMSVFGALAGYSLGILIWKAGGKDIIYYFIAPDKFALLLEKFTTYQAWTTFMVALSPMPFKLLTLSAGFFRLPLTSFLFFSLLARGSRFFAISGAIYIWGEKVSYYLNKYFYFFVALFCALMVGSWYITH
ncbi:hypothetical protein H0X06_06365 [Candidatus Dependentiae bacterium]|nr:hypothetical protein [Candidatus Dependentiae bacterium]